MRHRISLPDSMYPAQSFFNSLRDKDFIDALDCFAQGHGYSIEGAICSFPLNLSEDLGGSADQYGYIEFWTYAGNQEASLSFSEFIKILAIAADDEIKHNPDAAKSIKEKMPIINKTINDMEDRHRRASGPTS